MSEYLQSIIFWVVALVVTFASVTFVYNYPKLPWWGFLLVLAVSFLLLGLTHHLLRKNL